MGNQKIEVSILMSCFERLPLTKRVLYSIANNKPSLPFELVLADETGDDSILRELENFSSMFPWTYVKVDMSEFTEKTGITKYHNNPSLTNNIAFAHSKGKYIFLQGNECIAWKNPFDQMIKEANELTCQNYLVFSTTYDLPFNVLTILDDYGSSLNQNMVEYCKNWPLADNDYHSDVTNYLSLCSRNTWESVGGYNEQYLAGVACEDSDFVRRCRRLPDFKLHRSSAISLHQFHNGRSKYYLPTERGMNEDIWDRGLQINRRVYNDWDNSYSNPQKWLVGTYGVKNVITNGY